MTSVRKMSLCRNSMLVWLTAVLRVYNHILTYWN